VSSQLDGFFFFFQCKLLCLMRLGTKKTSESYDNDTLPNTFTRDATYHPFVLFLSSQN
jgi:hypothetical protein